MLEDALTDKLKERDASTMKNLPEDFARKKNVCEGKSSDLEVFWGKLVH